MIRERCENEALAWRIRLVRALLARSALVLAACATAPASALEGIRFNQASEAQGLSQGTVQAIAQDPDGFIWLGTHQGLNRYDGHAFVSYFHDAQDPGSLNGDIVWALHIDAAGDLWVGTQLGLNRFDRERRTFTRFEHDPADPKSLPPGQVRAIVTDAENGLWVGTDGGGVGRLDPATGRFKRFSADPQAPGALRSDRVKTLHVDPSGYVWVGTDGGGLSRIDPVRERIRHVELPGSNGRVRSVVSDSVGMLWVASYEQGLFLVDPQKGMLRRYRHDPDDSQTLSSDSLRVLFTDDRQQLWIGTDSHGVNRLDPGTGAITRIRHEPAVARSLSDDHVAAIFQDQGGVLWIGTYRGFNTWNPLNGAFSAFSRGALQSSLSNDTILALAEHPDGRLLVGSNGGGIDVVDLESGGVERLGWQDGRSHLSDDRVFALHVDRSQRLWAGTRAGGLNRLDLESGSWRVFRNDPDDERSLSFDGVTSILETHDGELWFGTYLGGLNRFDADSATFDRFGPDPRNPKSSCTDRILDLLEDRNGRFLVGSHTSGFCEFDRATGVFHAFRHDPDDPQSISSDKIMQLAEDASGNLWIGTQDRGLNLWRARYRQEGRAVFQRFSRADGLNSETVYGLLSDAKGRLWVAGNRGITRIDPETLRTRAYTVVDGLHGNEFNLAASLRSASGRLFFGGMNGLTGFFPESIDVNHYAPKLALTRFEQNDKEVPLVSQRNALGELRLPHTVRRIAFEFAALDFTDPASNRYEHRLIGFDADWVPGQGRRRVSYTNLPAGSYALQVRATNNDGVPSANELNVPLIMVPAPWATWWAQASYVLAALLVFYGVYRSQARKLEDAAEMNRVQSSLISEITARQIKEAELAQTRNRAQRYLDVVEVIILALDRSGNVTLVNQKGVRVLGYDEAEIVGRNFYECFVPDAQRDEVRTKFQNLDRYAYSESPIKPKEGDERMIAWHAIAAPPLDDDDDEAGGVLISGADVTQMRNLERQLRDAQKMDALGTLARGVAHDFNNILTSILGYVQLAQLAKPKATVAGHLDKLETSVIRARDLVARILSFGRASGHTPRVVRLDEITRDALELVTPLFGPNVRIVTALEGADGAVLADSTQLLQVVLNLCTNAAQAMGEDGGTLRVGVSNYEVGVEEARNLAVLVPGEHVRLTVSDTGPGMDDYTLTRIFDPFFTTRRREEGTGLGLSVVHRIVTQLRGAVQVFSSPGEGTRFEILLPRTRRQPDAVPTAPEPEIALEGSETLLFVDDEPSVRAIGKEALSKLGYRVLLASDAPEALELFEQRAGEIDAVVTDQTMPSQLGHKLAEALKAIRPEVPVLLMSGADRPESSYVDGFVEKPFSLSTLARAVRGLLTETPPAADEARH